MNRWDNLRLAVLERDKYEGQRCHLNFPKFDVHHMKLIKEPDGRWYLINSIDNIVTLCTSCHKKVQAQFRNHQRRLDKITREQDHHTIYPVIG